MYIYIYIYIEREREIFTPSGKPSTHPARPVRSPGESTTPGLHNKIPALKIFARGWVAHESIFVTLSTLRFSRGWVRKDGNLVMETGCIVVRVFWLNM